jgi:predicted DNA-binding transcriptional regulator AlpA
MMASCPNKSRHELFASANFRHEQLVSAHSACASLPISPSRPILLSNISLANGAKLDILPTPSGGLADSARAAAASQEHFWITAPQLARELGISRRTLTRWLRTVPLGFPRPRVVNHRLFFERSAIEAWKTATAVKAAGAR